MAMDKFKDLIKKVPVPDSIQNTVMTALGKNPAAASLNKELTDKKDEQIKVYQLIGMEVYDLVKEGRTDIPQIKGYIDKIDDIIARISELEKSIEQLEAEKAGGKRVCSCGCELAPGAHFCPKCGASVAVQNTTITCTCGAVIPANSVFCISCGKRIAVPAAESDLLTTAAEPKMKQCICGAMVPEGQFVCYECGRKVE